MRPLRDSSDIRHDIDILRERMGGDGYLYIREFIPKEKIVELRRAVLEIVESAGWLAQDGNLEERLVAPSIFFLQSSTRAREVLAKIYHLESFHALPHDENIAGFFRRFLGEEVLLNPNHGIRMVFPVANSNNAPYATTRPHQDFPTIQGTVDAYTSWLPLHSCSKCDGPVVVAQGSHKYGVYPRELAPHGGCEIIETFDGNWLGGDINEGDLLIFNSLTVHKALPNLTNKMRFSMDFRYQRLSDPIDQHSVCDTSVVTGLPWDSIYANFEDESLCFYWKKLCLTAIESDQKYNRELEEIVLAEGRRGNRNAKILLRVIAEHCKDAFRKEEAGRLLFNFTQ